MRLQIVIIYVLGLIQGIVQVQGHRRPQNPGHGHGWTPSRRRTTAQPEVTTFISTENPAVTRFRQYLRTNSSHPDPNYDDSVKWIERQASEIGLKYRKINLPPPALFAIRVTWKGSDPSLQSIMLNSHIDVVSVDRTKWKYDPFAAVKDEEGNIYARGAQDRKSLGSQYLETIRRLKAKGFVPLRTVHVTFVPDEELGGARGMVPFLKSNEFKRMNVGLEMDEGAATGGEYSIFYGERSIWQFKVIATGMTGHAAFLLEDNAAVKLEKVISKLLQFRQEQVDKLKANPDLEAGDVTSINLSQLGGGTQPNVIPSEMWAIFDMRIKIEPNWQFSDVEAMLNEICTQAGPGVRYEFILKNVDNAMTSVDSGDFWWATIRNAFNKMGWVLKPKIFPAATDARHVRIAGIPAFGFSPLLNTEPVQHQDNEYINEDTYLKGIDFYEVFLPKLANAL